MMISIQDYLHETIERFNAEGIGTERLIIQMLPSVENELVSDSESKGILVRSSHLFAPKLLRVYDVPVEVTTQAPFPGVRVLAIAP